MKSKEQKYFIKYKSTARHTRGSNIETVWFEYYDNLKIVLSGYKKTPYIEVLNFSKEEI